MCVYSMIGDHYTDKWKPLEPLIPQQIPNIPQKPLTKKEFDDLFKIPTPPGVTQKEFDELRKEVLEMKELLKRAIKYDEEHNEPHCEMEEKIALLKRVADMVGVSLEDVFPPAPILQPYRSIDISTSFEVRAEDLEKYPHSLTQQSITGSNSSQGSLGGGLSFNR